MSMLRRSVTYILIGETLCEEIQNSREFRTAFFTNEVAWGEDGGDSQLAYAERCLGWMPQFHTFLQPRWFLNLPGPCLLHIGHKTMDESVRAQARKPVRDTVQRI